MLPEFTKYLDMQYSLGIIEKLISFQSNPDLGYRTSGSAAEFAAADFLHGEMKRIGLKNVHKEAVTVDNFEFKRADLVYKLSNRNERKVILSAFQANCHAENEKIRIVYVGKGRDVDYEKVDVAGKYVLADINMIDDWFIYWTLGQARTKKAAGVIAVQVGGYCSWSKDTLGVQDICAPADTPAFSMTVREADYLKQAIAENGGEIEAVLNADVTVINNGITHNVIGEIPGKTEEVIYLIGHYDGYFRAFADNPSGVACILGICRAFILSRYKPRRTLRVIFHGAEEWGAENTRYDWACGAAKLTEKHPEWGENGFLLVNLDGSLISSTASAVKVRTSYEMAEGINAIGQKIEGNIYPFGTLTPLWTWTESYMYAMRGIPGIESFYEPANFWPSYHSTSDTKEVNDYSDRAYMSSHILYGTFLQKFDDLDTRPLDFTALFDKMNNSIDETVMSDVQELRSAIAAARAAAEKLNARKGQLTGLGPDTLEFNRKISRIFARIVNELFGLDWYETYDFIHARNQNNIDMLQRTIESIRAGELDKAVDVELRGVDLCWYAYNFDKDTYDFYVDQVLGNNPVETWAKGKVNSIADLWQTARDLQKKRTTGEGDLEQIISQLERELKKQRRELKDKMETEVSILKDLTSMMNELVD